MKDVKGKVAFITGGASGMGLGMARAFSDAGMKIMIADIEAGPAQRAVDELKARGHDAACLQVDVTNLEAMQAAAKKTVGHFGKVHVLCNNAGIAVGGKSETASMRNWHWVMDVNLWGVVHGLQAFVPLILAHGEGGHVVNTASMAGIYGVRGTGPYNASKFAVVGMTETMMAEHRKSGLGVSLLCPGVVNTNLSSSVRNRPEQYGGAVTGEKGATIGSLAAGLNPDIVGKLVLEAILDDQPYIFTDPALRNLVELRNKRLMAGYDWADKAKALEGAVQSSAVSG
ncbi:MAG: SDR family NAD(P)-dependent oxidoreductase [Alphaproteobacteria bacterium]|nr:SDR family NAD(P)-dependent oxidoreductase [Alphaproteobacteria bacterium]